MDELRILIIADDPLARAGLATLLADQPGYVIVGQIAGGEDALADLTVYQPEVILWDLGWSPDDSLGQLAELSETIWPIVALLPDETHAGEAWNAGLRGLLLRNADVDKILAALSAVAQQLVLLDPDLVEEFFPAPSTHTIDLVEDLTRREAEVLQLLAEGLPNKSIARKLDISDHTVKFHVNAILSKLDAQSRTEAVVRATRLGLILL